MTNNLNKKLSNNSLKSSNKLITNPNLDNLVSNKKPVEAIITKPLTLSPSPNQNNQSVSSSEIRRKNSSDLD